MKRILIFCLILTLFCTGCAKRFSQTQTFIDESGFITDEQGLADAAVPVVTVKNEEILYNCEQCGKTCKYFTGRFNCPSISEISSGATSIDSQISEEYEKYLSMAKAANEAGSGLAYAFTYSTYEDEGFIVIRTNVAAVMLHSGGNYSYTLYYYNIDSKNQSDCRSFANHLGLDMARLASFVRLHMKDSGMDFTDDELYSVTEDCIEIFPEQTGTFVRVKNEIVKYEFTYGDSELAAMADRITAEMDARRELTAEKESAKEELAAEDERRSAQRQDQYEYDYDDYDYDTEDDYEDYYDGYDADEYDFDDRYDLYIPGNYSSWNIN